MNIVDVDFLIIGSGAAGLSAALFAADYGKVAIITKSKLDVSSSYWAQGGIAAVLDDEDSFEHHIQDTLKAGRGNNNRAAVEVLVREGRQRVLELIEHGMPFDRKDGALVLGLEGGHSHRRILHSNGAATGKALVQFLMGKVEQNEAIQCFEQTFVYRLLTQQNVCTGAAAFILGKNEAVQFRSQSTILATGGYSGLFRRSTNPHTSTGDGLWLAHQAGAELADLEFVQFHPTAFYDESGKTFLISEAVRGEGARLINKEGMRFMEHVDEQELAPRDVVSQAIFDEMHRYDDACVYLKATHLESGAMAHHFPGLAEKIGAYGLNFDRDPIPVAPAAHYAIGGVVTDLNGKTAVDRLYACGEVASNGVHGANRLASNSLLECLVFGNRAAKHAAQSGSKKLSSGEKIPDFIMDADRAEEYRKLKNKVADILSDYVGIVRSEKLLQQGIADIQQLENAWNRHTWNEYFNLRSKKLLQIARQIAHSALARTESRGVHTRIDYPSRAAEAYQVVYKSAQHRPQKIGIDQYDKTYD